MENTNLATLMQSRISRLLDHVPRTDRLWLQAELINLITDVAATALERDADVPVVTLTHAEARALIRRDFEDQEDFASWEAETHVEPTSTALVTAYRKCARAPGVWTPTPSRMLKIRYLDD
jgi:hypothetical protein